MGLIEILNTILDNLEKYRELENDFRIDDRLYSAGKKLIDGIKQNNKELISEAYKILNEFLQVWRKKKPKDKVRLYRCLLALVLSFTSVVSKSKIRRMMMNGEIPSDDSRVPVFLDFLDKIEKYCSELYLDVRDVLYG